MITVPSTKFSKSRNLANGNITLVAEASDLRMNTPSQGLAIKSARTGTTIRFQLALTTRDGEGDVCSWRFEPIEADRAAANGTQVLVFND